jgi:hypothetical protein
MRLALRHAINKPRRPPAAWGTALRFYGASRRESSNTDEARFGSESVPSSAARARPEPIPRVLRDPPGAPRPRGGPGPGLLRLRSRHSRHSRLLFTRGTRVLAPERGPLFRHERPRGGPGTGTEARMPFPREPSRRPVEPARRDRRPTVGRAVVLRRGPGRKPLVLRGRDHGLHRRTGPSPFVASRPRTEPSDPPEEPFATSVVTSPAGIAAHDRSNGISFTEPLRFAARRRARADQDPTLRERPSIATPRGWEGSPRGGSLRGTPSPPTCRRRSPPRPSG